MALDEAAPRVRIVADAAPICRVPAAPPATIRQAAYLFRSDTNLAEIAT
jgi:hypothetical protein